MIVRFPNGWRAGETDDQLLGFIDFAPTVLSLVGLVPPEHLDGRAFLGPQAVATPRRYVHGAADRFDRQYDTIRAVRDRRFKYLRNLQPDRGYYLPLTYREQMPIMQELLRLRDAGELNAIQVQWFRDRKPDEELFDTESDPHELRNLADDPAFADTLAELRTECDRWMEAVDDRGVEPEPELIARIWPGRQQPATLAPEFAQGDGRVALMSGTLGASIGYQRLTGAAEVGSVWQVYTEPLAIEAGERVVAVAHRLGFAPSPHVVFGGR